MAAVITLLTSCSETPSGVAGETTTQTSTSGQQTSAPPTTTAPPTPAAPTTPAVQALAATRQWEWASEDGRNYTATHVLAIGSPTPVGQVPVLSGFTPTSAASTCGVTAGTDAVLPFQLSTTNTTTGFPYSTNVQVKSQKPAVPVAVGYQTGPVCENANGYAGWSLECADLAPSASCTVSGYIILQDYFNPGSPQGDESVLGQYLMLVGSETANGDPISLTSMTGPGSDVFGGYQGEFRLSGT